MVAIQNQKTKVPRKFVRLYHLKQLFYERFPDKEERKKQVTAYAKALEVSTATVRLWWSIRPNSSSDMAGLQLKATATFFDVKMETLFNTENEVF